MQQKTDFFIVSVKDNTDRKRARNEVSFPTYQFRAMQKIFHAVVEVLRWNCSCYYVRGIWICLIEHEKRILFVVTRLGNSWLSRTLSCFKLYGKPFGLLSILEFKSRWWEIVECGWVEQYQNILSQCKYGWILYESMDFYLDSRAFLLALFFRGQLLV